MKRTIQKAILEIKELDDGETLSIDDVFKILSTFKDAGANAIQFGADSWQGKIFYVSLQGLAQREETDEEYNERLGKR